jgi:hypothetical protein
MASWARLGVPHVLRAAAVHDASWASPAACHAAVSLLACLHQLQEDTPGSADATAGLLRAEEAAIAAGLAEVAPAEAAALAASLGANSNGASAGPPHQVLARLWSTGSGGGGGGGGSGGADAAAAASAAAVVTALARAPVGRAWPATLASAGHWWAAAGAALHEAAC